MLIKCVKDGETDLKVDKLYRTIPDEMAVKCGLVRVIDESNESYLYPATWFAAPNKESP